jgi:hypothetical protein
MKPPKPAAKTRAQMAYEYGVCRRTFYALLKKHEIYLSKGLIMPREQTVIYKKLGRPRSLSQKLE